MRWEKTVNIDEYAETIRNHRNTRTALREAIVQSPPHEMTVRSDFPCVRIIERSLSQGFSLRYAVLLRKRKQISIIKTSKSMQWSWVNSQRRRKAWSSWMYVLGKMKIGIDICQGARRADAGRIARRMFAGREDDAMDYSKMISLQMQSKVGKFTWLFVPTRRMMMGCLKTVGRDTWFGITGRNCTMRGAT